jgi:exodeoxyribonuclease VII small subunit
MYMCFFVAIELKKAGIGYSFSGALQVKVPMRRDLFLSILEGIKQVISGLEEDDRLIYCLKMLVFKESVMESVTESDRNEIEPPVQFEASLEALEQIVVQLEKGDLKLEEALQAFEKGVGLTRVCRQILDQAQLKIEKLSQGSEGEQIEPFEQE